MADFERLIAAIGRQEAMIQNKQEKIKTSQEKVMA
jgi:hypothetical protein